MSNQALTLSYNGLVNTPSPSLAQHVPLALAASHREVLAAQGLLV